MHRGTQTPAGDDSGDERDCRGGERCGKDITRGGRGQIKGKGRGGDSGETFTPSLQVALASGVGENLNTKQKSFTCITCTSQPKTYTRQHVYTSTQAYAKTIKNNDP